MKKNIEEMNLEAPRCSEVASVDCGEGSEELVLPLQGELVPPPDARIAVVGLPPPKGLLGWEDVLLEWGRKKG